MVIPFYLANGATLKEALDWCVSGCCENRIPNRETNVTAGGGINYGSITEMTVRNGKLKVLHDLQFGLQTGDPRSWTSFDQVWDAFKAQMLHLADHVLIQQISRHAIEAGPFCRAADLDAARSRDEGMPRPAHARPVFRGRHRSLDLRGDRQGTAIDSLAAIKHLIFDMKTLTWDELLAAIEANWEGHEATRQLCLNAPKYGNGIAWVDAIGFDIERTLLEYLHAHPKPHGQVFLLRQHPDHPACAVWQGDLGDAERTAGV